MRSSKSYCRFFSIALGLVALPLALTRVAPADRTRAMEIARSNREFERQRTQAEAARGRTAGAGRAGAGAVVSTPEKATLPRRSAIVSPRPTKKPHQ